MDIQALKLNLCRVFDDKLKTKQWHNILDAFLYACAIYGIESASYSTFASCISLYEGV